MLVLALKTTTQCCRYIVIDGSVRTGVHSYPTIKTRIYP